MSMRATRRKEHFHGKIYNFLTALFERFYEMDQMKWLHA